MSPLLGSASLSTFETLECACAFAPLRRDLFHPGPLSPIAPMCARRRINRRLPFPHWPWLNQSLGMKMMMTKMNTTKMRMTMVLWM